MICKGQTLPKERDILLEDDSRRYLPLYIAYACEEPSAGPDDGRVWSSQVEEAVTQLLWRHTIQWGYKVSDSNGDDEEEELSIEFSETHCQSDHPLLY